MPANPSDADPNDADFMDNLQRLLGIDAKGVQELIPKIRPSMLIDLAAAVTNGDKRQVLAMIRAGREQPVAEALRPPPRQRKPDARDDDDAPADLSVGDAVRVNGKDATVQLAKGPGNTVGVMVGGRMEMVRRAEVTKVNEGVLGMSGIPDLRRMQELAGIATGMPGMPGMAMGGDAEAALPAEAPASISFEPIDTGAAPGDCGASALSVLDRLSTMLPNLRLADIKSVRKRMNDIIVQMNESAGLAPSVANAFAPDKPVLAERRKPRR